MLPCKRLGFRQVGTSLRSAHLSVTLCVTEGFSSNYTPSQPSFQPQKKNRRRLSADESLGSPESALSLLCKAFAAIYRTVVVGLERDSCFLAAGCANSCVVLLALLLLSSSAILAHLGLVFEALLCIEFLLAGCKNEFFSAITAYQFLVFVHIIPSLHSICRAD